MALDATEVVVAGTGHLYVADEGTTLPTDLTDLSTDPDFTELGYTTEDGVTWTVSRQTSDLNVWQSLDPIRIITSSRTQSMAATLRQFSPENLRACFGGGTIDAAAGVGSFQLPDPAAIEIKVLVVDFSDGDADFRSVFERAQQDGDVTAALNRGDSANLPFSMRILAGSEEPIIYSNHPAWLSAS
jgi:hypothetical protein